MRTMFNDLLKNESGVTAIEYGLIAALIAIVIVAILQAVGGTLSNTFATVNSDL
jgi:pilus assembly protein Flp/PilA